MNRRSFFKNAFMGTAFAAGVASGTIEMPKPKTRFIARNRKIVLRKVIEVDEVIIHDCEIHGFGGGIIINGGEQSIITGNVMALDPRHYKRGIACFTYKSNSRPAGIFI